MRHWPAGYDRRLYDSIDSTLSEAARLAPQVTHPTWLLALEQTAARGRRGRLWSTKRGNFASALLTPRRDGPDRAALRSFVASLALYHAFDKATGQAERFTLKWPNDVLLDGGKVAGILLESLPAHLAIGIGVNLAHAPAPTEVEAGAVPPVSIATVLDRVIRPEDFLELLAAEYAILEERFVTYGFAAIRRAWLARAARLGEEITARTTRAETRGVFEDVDDSGALILRTAQGRHAVSAADVYF